MLALALLEAELELVGPEEGDEEELHAAMLTARSRSAVAVAR
jgi:hypothetical protein